MPEVHSRKTAAAFTIIFGLLLPILFQNCGGPPQKACTGADCEDGKKLATALVTKKPASNPIVGLGGRSPIGGGSGGPAVGVGGGGTGRTPPPQGGGGGGGGGGGDGGTPARFELLEHPTSQTVNEGSRVTLTVRVATTGPAPIFQWFHNDQPLTAEPGITFQTLSFVADGTWKRGRYYVKVWETDRAAEIKSETAVVTIQPIQGGCAESTYYSTASTRKFADSPFTRAWSQIIALQPYVIQQDFLPKYFADHEFRYMISAVKRLSSVSYTYGDIFTDYAREGIDVGEMRIHTTRTQGETLAMSCQTEITGFNSRKSGAATGDVRFVCENGRYRFVANTCREH